MNTISETKASIGSLLVAMSSPPTGEPQTTTSFAPDGADQLAIGLIGLIGPVLVKKYLGIASPKT